VLLTGCILAKDDLHKQTESIKLAPNSFYTTNFILVKDGNATIKVTGDKSREFIVFAHPNSDIKDDIVKCPGFYNHEVKKLATLPFSEDELTIVAEETGHYGVYIVNNTKSKIHFTVSFHATKGKFIHTYHK
jgi:hypothetical protein